MVIQANGGSFRPDSEAPFSPQALSALLNPRPKTQTEAAELLKALHNTLSELKPDAEGLVQALTDGLAHPQEEIRLWALEALKTKVERHALWNNSDLYGKLFDRLRSDPSEAVRQKIPGFIEYRFDVAGRHSLAECLDGLKDGEKASLRRHMAFVLGGSLNKHSGWSATEQDRGEERLWQLLESEPNPDSQICQHARQGVIGRAINGEIRHSLAALTHQKAGIRRLAIEALGWHMEAARVSRNPERIAAEENRYSVEALDRMLAALQQEADFKNFSNLHELVLFYARPEARPDYEKLAESELPLIRNLGQMLLARVSSVRNDPAAP